MIFTGVRNIFAKPYGWIITERLFFRRKFHFCEIESYEHMRPKADGILISKTRYLIPEKDRLTIELDVFDAPYEGLYLAEVEDYIPRGS